MTMRMTAGEDEACICHLINFPGLSAPLDGVLYAPLAGHGRCGGWLVHGMLPQGPTMSSVQLHTHYAYSDDYNGGVGRGNAWRLQTDEQRIIGRG